MAGYMDQIYAQLNQTFGGSSNPNQLFTMVMPGTVLDPATYAYDTSGAKPAVVAERESELVNQMFDIAEITAGSNGRRVSDQFLAALGSLVPKFDANLAKVKKALRDVLNSTPDYTLPDGSKFKGSFEQLFFLLYSDWIASRQRWDDLQQQERSRLESSHPGDPVAVEDGFTRWFETEGEGHLATMDATMGKVLALFSPDDMDAMFGVLEAGVGGRLEQARRAVMDIRRPTPDGGWTFPVELRPADWHTSLVSDKNPVDLLEDPAYIALKLQARHSALQASMDQVQALLAQQISPDELKRLRDDVNARTAALHKAQTDLLTTYTDNAVIAAKIYLAAETGGATALLDGNEAETFNGLVDDVASAKTGEKKTDEAGKAAGGPLSAADVDAIADGQKALIGAQDAYVSSAQDVANAARAAAAGEAGQLSGLSLLATRLSSLIDEVATMQSQLQASSVKKVAATATPAAPSDELTTSYTPQDGPIKKQSPSRASDRFMELTIYFSQEDIKQNDSARSGSSNTAWSVNLFIASASGQNSSSSASSLHDMLDTSTNIEIGMSCMKVEIDRPWMDPGVFMLGSDLLKIAEEDVSQGPVAHGDLADPDKRKAFDARLFPCYPTAFVVAKDITIKFKAADSKLHAAKSVADSQSSVGGGFLCFSASRSDSSHSSSGSLASTTEGQVVTIHIPAPQIVGWFLEYTPNTTHIETLDADRDQSILTYVAELSKELAVGTTNGQPELPVIDAAAADRALLHGAQPTQA